MNLILNIGTARKGTNIGIGTALRDLASFGFTINKYTVQHSDTEITLVADVDDGDLPGLDNRVDMLSRLLGQDCIAVYDTEACEGSLIGPRSDAWGEFNPDFFLLLDGSRLGNPLQVAA